MFDRFSGVKNEVGLAQSLRSGRGYTVADTILFRKCFVLSFLGLGRRDSFPRPLASKGYPV
jgi:hypothetical protein